MSDQDQITKKQAKNWVKHVYPQGCLAVCAAIDALTPIPVSQDTVSREAVRDLAISIKAATDLGQSVASELRAKGKKVTHRKVDFLEELKKLPPACTEPFATAQDKRSERVLPAGRSESLVPRDEEEIRVLDFAVKIARVMKEISSSHVYFILQQAFGEELDWSEATKILSEVIDFTPPKNRKEKSSETG